MMNLEAGFIGLGAMGLPMADRLVSAGVRLTVFNRTSAKAQPLTDKGAKLAPAHGDTAAPGGIVFTMLADDAAVEAMVLGDGGIARRLAPGGIHVSMSTIAPSTARRLARYHAECGSAYIAAPVLGRPDRAAAGQLVISTSGPIEAKARIRPLLELMGQEIYDYGEEPGAANVVKLAANFLIAAAIEAMAEAFAMVERNGIDRQQVAGMLGQTLLASPVYQGYGEMVAAKRHSPAGFKLVLGLKDIDLVLKTAGEARVPVPAAALVRDRILAGLAHGREAMDWSALACVLDDAALAH
jgi:3-hydroxyisobutyrate dehydrogenase-like beta-hydroxyacid dehydrogenase